MHFDCFEWPIPPSEYTPEKGRAQLQRMKACYDRRARVMATLILIMVAGFVIDMALIILAAVL